MALFALSDLHLSLNTDKPMDIFGEAWRDHHNKILLNWNSQISKEDTVLVSGDLSWGMKLEEAMADLEYIHNLNGKKIIIKGNHDYWWSSITKLNALFDDMFFIQNNHYSYEDYGICGTRGWVSMDGSKEHDEKVYNRELMRLRASLDSAAGKGFEKFIVMMHYPPVTKISKSQEFLDLLSEYNVEKLIYGHIHYDSRSICINGIYNGMEYQCTSADIINFNPLRIL